MGGWHHQLNGHEFEQIQGDIEGNGRLACCMQFVWLQRVGHNLVNEQQQWQNFKLVHVLKFDKNIFLIFPNLFVIVQFLAISL